MKNEPADDSETESPEFRLGRRQLLRGALIAGATVPFAACTAGASSGTSQPGETPTPTPTPTPSSGQGSGTGGGGGGGGGGTVAPTPVRYSKVETWNEPWVWRPSDWPTDTLDLNVIENQNPGSVIGFGNPNHVLFSYGGSTPGPTVRMSGDEILAVTLRNLLGPDQGITYVGAYPDPGPLTGFYNGEELTKDVAQMRAEKLGNKRHDFCLGEHTNGIHTVHTTNMHTHGLHVRPGRNPDGTHSDNIYLRVMPQQDLARREAIPEGDTDIVCNFLRAGDQTDFLRDNEQVGKADYEFRLGDVQGDRDQPHPPGTHWYHPHSHGGTADQVTSGMAGFLIVEGNVEEEINKVLVPDQAPHTVDPSLKSGDNDYRERLMFMQRVLNVPTDPDAGPGRQNLQNNARSNAEATNGLPDPATLLMRPNAVERWRVLNGSVDGKGYRRVMVLKGRFGTDAKDRLIRIDDNGEPSMADGKPLPPVKRAEMEELKMPLRQLAFDGVTLVDSDGNYFLKDLADQGSGDPSPLDSFPGSDFQKNFDNYVSCFADGDSIRNCYVRPNEVYLGPANRTDLIFQAPADEVPKDKFVDYTVIALGVLLHADTPIFLFQKQIRTPFSRDLNGAATDPPASLPTPPGDVILGRLRVTGTACPSFDLDKIDDALPKAPAYLQPINDDDPKLKTKAGKFRTRTVTYSGWGAAGMPLIDCNVSVESTADADGYRKFADRPDDNNTPTSIAFAKFIRDNPDLEGLRYARRLKDPAVNGQQAFVLLAPNTRTMAIDGRKFNPTDPDRPRMFLNSAEEWAVYNNSDFLWGDTSAALPPNQHGGSYAGVPLTLERGMEEFAKNDYFHLLTRAVDHPFHMHQNPFWVMRIDVPGQDGKLHNILEEPRWQDVVPVPRHRGRVVFRSRFDDFVGTYVNHCHLLQHEDNGMMQPVEVVPFDQSDKTNSFADPLVGRANYTSADELARGGFDQSATDHTDELYPQPSLEDSYQSNVSFIDANATGQIYPGFDVETPTLPS